MLKVLVVLSQHIKLGVLHQHINNSLDAIRPIPFSDSLTFFLYSVLKPV